MTISVSPSAKRNTSKVNLPQSAHQEVREVIARDFNYGLKNLEEGLSTPVRFSGTNRLIKLEAQKQAAERLGLSHDAVRKRCQRAMARLRQHPDA